MIHQLETRSALLLEFYEKKFKDFLTTQAVHGTDTLDRLTDNLRTALSRRPEVHIGFVGESQVGKSTLINALLERYALPSGGIGPLTAQQTRVRYGADDRISVQYHGRGAINRLAFGLAKHLQMRGELSASSSPEVVEDPGVDSSDALLTEEGSTESGPTSGVSERAKERANYMFAQGRRMLGAPVDTAPQVIVDALRDVLGQKPHGDPSTLEPMRERILELRGLLGKEEVVTTASAGGRGAFRKSLHERAAGWRSPLVEQLSLELTSPEMEGLNLVDLPGIGVVGDAAANEAQRFVQTEGDALVIVFKNSGITENVATLLERSMVISRLLLGGRDGAQAIQVVIAVTRLDDVAKTKYTLLARDARENEEPAPDRSSIFRNLADEMARTVREQLHTALMRSPSFEGLEGVHYDARTQVVDRLCAELKIFCVAAPDYLQLMMGDTDGLAFLRDKDATGVPALRTHLREMARTHRTERQKEIERNFAKCVETIEAHLVNMRRSFEDGGGVASDRLNQFTQELTEFAQPLRNEMRALHGEIAGTLRRGLLERIEALCAEGENHGLKRLRSLRRRAQEMHYQSLNAALRHDGVWEMRGFNFPDGLTRAFVDSVATAWEPQIIQAVRGEIRRLADRDLALVEQLIQKARELDSQIAQERPLDEQKRILRENSQSAVAWTKEQLEELREEVQSKLRGAVAKPIERACREAIKAGRNVSSGAKLRIIEVFEDSGAEALVEARKEAKRVLEGAYKKLLRKLEEGYLRDIHDPVQSALETLTDQVGERARRSDAQKRRATLAAIAMLSQEVGSLTSSDASAAA